MEKLYLGYKKQEIVEMCTKAFSEKNTFYKQNFINYRGKTYDTNEFYTEIIAQFILDNIEDFQNGIPMITRKTTYKTEGHNGIYSSSSNRLEEIIAMKMYKQGIIFDEIGKIIDYQIPLKSQKKDIAGKIDLLSYNGKNNTVFVLELKKPDSTETMLRCVLEGYTYMQTVDREKMLKDFELPSTANVVTSPFVFRNGKQGKEMLEGRPILENLMRKLSIKPYYIKKENELFLVEEKNG